MIGASVYVFGGEDRSRRAVNDLYVLDMATLAWSRPETQVGLRTNLHARMTEEG